MQKSAVAPSSLHLHVANLLLGFDWSHRTTEQSKEKPKLLEPYLLQDQHKKLSEEQKQPEILQSSFADLLLHRCQEVAVHPPDVAFAIRPSIGVWEYVKISTDDMSVLPLGIPEYLEFKEHLVGKVPSLCADGQSFCMQAAFCLSRSAAPETCSMEIMSECCICKQLSRAVYSLSNGMLFAHLSIFGEPVCLVLTPSSGCQSDAK